MNPRLLWEPNKTEDKTMANTYTQLQVHLVFAVAGRENLIPEYFREDLERYISGYARNKGVRLLALFCNPDHTHILIGYRPDLVLSDFVKDLKVTTNKFVNANLVLKGKFAWQTGYGAFSICPFDRQKVIDYILNQPFHHKNKVFLDEYKELLRTANVEYEDEYLFE